MSFNKITGFVVLFIVILSCSLILYEEFNQQKTPLSENCKNFNFKSFLESGGTKTIKTNKDLYEEGIRIKILCEENK